MLKKVKEMKDKTINYVKENKEIIVATTVASVGALVAVGVGVTMAKKSNSQKAISGAVEEKKVTWTDRFLYQLEDQDQVWMVITSDVDSKGNETDLDEIARQIANREFREG